MSDISDPKPADPVKPSDTTLDAPMDTSAPLNETLTTRAKLVLPEQTNNKAWAAGVTATLIMVAQALLGAGEAGKIIFTWMICGRLGAICPPPDDVLGAFLGIASAVAGGVLTGFVAWYVSNYRKTPIS